MAKTWDVEAGALTGRGRQLGPRERQARQVAMLLCRDETAMTLAAIGELFGGSHYSAVGQNIRRVQTAIKEDRELDLLYQTVMSRFDP